MRRAIQSLLLVLSFLLCAVAFAQEAPPPAPTIGLWQSVLPAVLAVLIPLVGTVLSAMAGWVLLLIRKRTGLALSQEQDEAIRRAIRAAISGAEEWAARAAKFNLVGGKPAGADKAAWVLNAVRSQWPKLLPDDLARMLDEELGRTAGAGATGALAVR